MGQDISIGNINLNTLDPEDREQFRRSSDVILVPGDDTTGDMQYLLEIDENGEPIEVEIDEEVDGDVEIIEEFEVFSLAEIQAWNIEEGLKSRNKSIGAGTMLDAISFIKTVKRDSAAGGVGAGGAAGTGYQGGTGPGTIYPTVPGQITNPIPGYHGNYPAEYRGSQTLGDWNTDGKGFWAIRSEGSRAHKGVDLDCSLGDPFVAPINGTITHWSESNLGGLEMWLEDGNGNKLFFCHLKDRYIKPETPVVAGQVLGTVGTTGHSGDYKHLHFGWYINDEPVDPVPILRGSTLLP